MAQLAYTTQSTGGTGHEKTLPSQDFDNNLSEAGVLKSFCVNSSFCVFSCIFQKQFPMLVNKICIGQTLHLRKYDMVYL